jgi:hypothetical protein
MISRIDKQSIFREKSTRYFANENTKSSSEKIKIERKSCEQNDTKWLMSFKIDRTFFVKIASSLLFILFSRTSTTILWTDIVLITNAHSKKMNESKNKSFWRKAFRRYLIFFLFIRSIINLYETRFMREKESFFRYTQQRFNDKLLKFVLNVNLFFKVIENSFFKNFVNYLRRDVDIFERIFFDKMMRKRTNQMKNDIFQNLEVETKIFIALNVWISFNHLTFFDVTAYFVDCEFRFRKIFIAFKSLSKQHTKKKLTETIMNILQDYKFIRRLMTIIVDNAFNNVTLRKHLFEKLTKMNLDWNSEIDIINCMIHVLQFFVITLLIALRVQVFNDDVNLKFDEKSLIEIFVAIFFENTLRKIIIHLFCFISID